MKTSERCQLDGDLLTRATHSIILKKSASKNNFTFKGKKPSVKIILLLQQHMDTELFLMLCGCKNMKVFKNVPS